MDNIEANNCSAPELGLVPGSAISLQVTIEQTGETFMWVAQSPDGKFVQQGRSPMELHERCCKALRLSLQNNSDEPTRESAGLMKSK